MGSQPFLHPLFNPLFHFLDADETEDDDPISPVLFSMDFPVTLEALSAPADLVELGLTLLRKGVE